MLHDNACIARSDVIENVKKQITSFQQYKASIVKYHAYEKHWYYVMQT